MARSDLPQDRAQFLDELAFDVWSELACETPTPVDSIASELRLGPSYSDFGTDFDGILEHRAGRFHIYCNITEGKHTHHPRVRFTLAHELGHYFIDEHRNALRAGQPPRPTFLDKPSNDPVEQEANAFAASLLMPRRAFQIALRSVPPGLKGILELGSTFRVSKQSAALRYANASGRECAIVMFRNDSPAWWEVSPSMERSGLDRINAQRTAIPPDSATGMALADSPSQASEPHVTNTLASSWFGGVPCGSRRDIFLCESALRLGSFGVLTLLEPRSPR